jgi:hypothetical protein
LFHAGILTAMGWTYDVMIDSRQIVRMEVDGKDSGLCSMEPSIEMVFNVWVLLSGSYFGGAIIRAACHCGGPSSIPGQYMRNIR